MKKYIPFIFPAIALLIVLFLGYRWYNVQTVKPTGQITDVGEGMKIDELSTEEMRKLQGGSKDLPTVELKGTGENGGQVRYEVSGERVSFSISADLPMLTDGFYQVWLKQASTNTQTKAFVLEEGKAGHMGSASVSSSIMPFEVIVSKETKNDDQIETVVLTGAVQK